MTQRKSIPSRKKLKMQVVTWIMKPCDSSITEKDVSIRDFTSIEECSRSLTAIVSHEIGLHATISNSLLDDTWTYRCDHITETRSDPVVIQDTPLYPFVSRLRRDNIEFLRDYWSCTYHVLAEMFYVDLRSSVDQLRAFVLFDNGEYVAHCYMSRENEIAAIRTSILEQARSILDPEREDCIPYLIFGVVSYARTHKIDMLDVQGSVLYNKTVQAYDRVHVNSFQHDKFACTLTEIA